MRVLNEIKMNIRNLRLMMSVYIMLLITGCGGGGGSSGAEDIVIAAGNENISLSVNAITDGNISWDFSSSVQSGKFANGDYWVVGPVTITAITPSYNGQNNGFEVNPSDPVIQGFDTRIAAFTPSVIPVLPFEAQPGHSVVKAVSANTSDVYCNPCIQSVSVLTVLSEPPPNNGLTVFRPPYHGTNKPLYSTDNINFSLLPNYQATANALDFSLVAEQYRPLQLDHKAGWTGRALHPADSMPDYGAAIASRNAEAAVTLMLQGSNSEKKQAVINYVNYGIDVYHMMKSGMKWYANGGHGEGRKLPAIMAAVLLENNVMKNDLANIDPSTFGETSGVYFSAIADGGAGQFLWGQETATTERHYWEMMVFNNGGKMYKDPYGQIDGGRLDGNSSYQQCCTTAVWESIVTALELMPSLKNVFNFPGLKIYTDRWASTGFFTQPDTCAPPSDPANFDSDYGVTFGPDGSGGCIPDLDNSDGIGRFPQTHGTKNDTYYGSSFVREMKIAYLP